MVIDLLATQRLPETCLDVLASYFTIHDLGALERDPALPGKIRAIAGGHADAALIERLPKLEIVATYGVGYDGIDLGAARRRGLRVANTPDVLNDAVAELALGMMIALARRIPAAHAFVRDGHWEQGGFGLQSELAGRTLGIVGLGRIGKEIALRAQAMKMRVVYHGRHAQARLPYRYYPDLIDMARDSDWLLTVTPGGPGTDGMVSRQVLEALGPRGRFVNVGRGSVVNETALAEMLERGELAGAALDVFDGEPKASPRLRALDNVLLSPHQGSATTDTRAAMADLMLANLRAHFAGDPLLTPVL